jgi:PPM family protein phosphatase
LQEDTPAEPDLFLLEARVGDRYLICSDGVTAVLDDPDLHEVLVAEDEPAEAVARLIELANEGGGPDNITCVVADLVDESVVADEAPVVVGSAAR